MTEQLSRECPLCHRMHILQEDGTIPSWNVTYEGEDVISKRSSNFIHQEDAQAEYNWIMRSLKESVKWERNKNKLKIEEGERASWADLFEEPGIHNWEA